MADTDNGSPAIEFAFVIPAEKFVFRRSGRWCLNEPVGQLGIHHHLLECGWSEDMIRTALRDHAYLRVYGYDLRPAQPDVWADADGRLYLNTWVKPTLAPAQGPYPRLQKALSWITNGDTGAETWLRMWMAAKVQQPLLVPKVAVVCATKQGGGKGLLASALSHMLGRDNCAVIDRTALESRFNARWADKLFVLGDEVISSDNLKDISQRLKILIDAEDIELEGKHKDQKSVRNKTAWLFASNDDITPVVVESSDRRYSVFVNHAPITPEYQAELMGCFEPDRLTPTASFRAELAGFYYDLLNMPVERLALSRPYANGDRSALIKANQASHTTFFDDIMDNTLDTWLERIVDHSRWDMAKRVKEETGEDGWISTDLLYECYKEFCSSANMRPLRRNKFGMACSNRQPAWEHARRSVGTRQMYGYIPTRQPH